MSRVRGLVLGYLGGIAVLTAILTVAPWEFRFACLWGLGTMAVLFLLLVVVGWTLFVSVGDSDVEVPKGLLVLLFGAKVLVGFGLVYVAASVFKVSTLPFVAGIGAGFALAIGCVWWQHTVQSAT